MKKFKYVALYYDGTWGIRYTHSADALGNIAEECRISRKNNSTKAIKRRVSTYLLGNESKIQAAWIARTKWTKEMLADCLENPSKYKREGIKKRIT